MTQCVIIVSFLAACRLGDGGEPDEQSEARQATAGGTKVGAAVTVEADFEHLAGKRIGLIANQASMVDTVHVVDLLHASPQLDLRVLFAPEHGFRGDVAGGLGIESRADPVTGLPVVSLYGPTRTPPPSVLDSLDALVFDIQDIGARFYTYISTMGYAMQAAARADIEFVVLDRPNPLGGEYVSGFVRDGPPSFVGLYEIPIAHGMTVGELARMVKGEAMLDSLENLNLTVVEMAGWSRRMLWPDTGLAWVATSPNIPDFETALVYPGMCLIEGTTASEGRGTDAPFKTFGAPGMDAAALVSSLRRSGLPGLAAREVTFTPIEIPGKAMTPKHEGVEIPGVSIQVTDAASYRPVEVGVHVLVSLAADRGAGVALRPYLTRLAGTDRLEQMLRTGTTADEIIASWQDEVDAFRELRRAYLMY